MQKENMSFWDERRVQFYIETWGPPDNPKKWRNKDRMETPVNLLKGDKVLDVGCGLGHLYYALRGMVAHYIGVDASSFMLQKAREYFPEADFRKGDAHDLSAFPIVDTVYSVSLLIHLESVDEPIRQLWSRAKERLVFLIPLGNREKIERPEPGLVYHQISFNKLDSILASLPDVKKIEKIHWEDRHHFVVLDR
ncbi:MAG: class I SAM-dependent methyltransferase [Theionarchaea archaeon]|nr:class I SAM-dependent methyltransferase [Theionarchaea archaeon]